MRVKSKRFVAVPFVCVSEREKAQTVRTVNLVGRTFEHGQNYLIELDGGSRIPCRVNRKDATTLYFPAKDWPPGLSKATVGSPVVRDVRLLGPLNGK